MGEKRFKVVFSPAAGRDIERISIGRALQVVRDIKNYLESTPFPFGKTRTKKLTGFSPSLYRLRSGNYRAYYRISGNEVIILAVTDKKDSEKLLKNIR